MERRQEGVRESIKIESQNDGGWYKGKKTRVLVSRSSMVDKKRSKEEIKRAKDVGND